MLDDERLHRHLIGQAGSGRLLNTPALVVDRDALDRNIATMAGYAKRAGVSLRPHAKTHKSADIARRQLAAGAAGICCAKLGEAEALAGEGIESILLTSPIVSSPAIARYVALNARLRDLAVVVDHPDNVAAIANALGPDSTNVLIDVDAGMRRTGVASADAAVSLLAAIQRHPNLNYRGIQFYAGPQHIASYLGRRDAIAKRTSYLETVVALLANSGGKPRVITGAGTGTHRIDAELGVLTEWQVGSYVFMDTQYAQCQLQPDPGSPFEYALFVDSRVISANVPGMGTLDAGFKALSTDGGLPILLAGAPEGAKFMFLGDEHGGVLDPTQKHAWQIGDSVRLAVPHCDPTVNLYDAYHVVQGDTLVEIWPVTARGRSR
jgi:D-serine deaminase-like pyridoxal phosphate-dependent protein